MQQKDRFLSVSTILLAIALMWLPTSVQAQGLYPTGDGDGGGMVDYAKGTVKTVQGEIKGVETVRNPDMNEDGLHLSFKTADEGYYNVHVAPQWYVDLKKFDFKEGEQLSILGSAFHNAGEQNLYAATITRGSAEIKLRNPESGAGLWMRRPSQGQGQGHMEGQKRRSMENRMRRGGY
ncbi:MAG: hypothetical protein HQL52_11280 [Magnetococcales bacterium]|nr:hypothetical protein [Magnetococcales bacterium]